MNTVCLKYTKQVEIFILDEAPLTATSPREALDCGGLGGGTVGGGLGGGTAGGCPNDRAPEELDAGARAVDGDRGGGGGC